MKENNVKMEVMYDISDRIKEIKNFARDNDTKISLFIVQDIIKNKKQLFKEIAIYGAKKSKVD